MSFIQNQIFWQKWWGCEFSIEFKWYKSLVGGFFVFFLPTTNSLFYLLSTIWISKYYSKLQPSLTCMKTVTWHLDTLLLSVSPPSRPLHHYHVCSWSHPFLLAGHVAAALWTCAFGWNSKRALGGAQARAKRTELQSSGPRDGLWNVLELENNQGDIPRLAANFTIIINLSLVIL